jgi:hypothetical protein
LFPCYFDKERGFQQPLKRYAKKISRGKQQERRTKGREGWGGNSLHLVNYGSYIPQIEGSKQIRIMIVPIQDTCNRVQNTRRAGCRTQEENRNANRSALRRGIQMRRGHKCERS